MPRLEPPVKPSATHGVLTMDGANAVHQTETMNDLESYLFLERQTSNLDEKNSRQKWPTEPDDMDDSENEDWEYDVSEDDQSDVDMDVADSSEEEDGDWDDTCGTPEDETN